MIFHKIIEEVWEERHKKNDSDTVNDQPEKGISGLGGSPLPSFLHLPDAELWKAFKAGNKEAFIFIYNKYFDKLYAYAYQFTSDRELIRDCIQDMFIALDRARTGLSDTDHIRLYLYKAIKRRILRANKKRKKIFTFSESEVHVWKFYIDESAEQKLINRQIGQEKIAELKKAVNRLPYKQREAIFYLYFEGFALSQIRELLDFRSIKATQNLIYAAIKKLRDILDT